MPRKNSHTCCHGKRLWSPDEDLRLVQFIRQHGLGSWSSVPKQAGLERSGKSCRFRWFNYLRPDLKRGTFSTAEVKLIISLHSLLGNRWSRIASCLPGRSDNEIKNFWNSIIKKQLMKQNRLINHSVHLMSDHFEMNVEEPIDTSPELTKMGPSYQKFSGGFSSNHTLIYGDVEVEDHTEPNASHELSESQGSNIDYDRFMEPFEDLISFSGLQILHEAFSTISKKKQKPSLPSSNIPFTQQGLPSSLVPNQNDKTSIMTCLTTPDSHTPLLSPLLSKPLSHECSLKANQLIENATNMPPTYNAPLLSQQDRLQASFLHVLEEIDISSLNNSAYIFDPCMDLSMLLLEA